MSKKLILFVLLILAALGFGGYKLIASRTARIAGLKVVSIPSASIFLDEKLIGKTPYDDKQSPGEYVLKLIADDPSVISWQGKVILNPALLTYVKRELGSSEITSAGDMLTLEKISGNEAQLAVFSVPDGATVIVDGQEKGTSPLVLRDVLTGEHDVAAASPGFAQRTVRIQATVGYKLNVNFQLALVGAPPTVASESAAITPTGTALPDQNKQPSVVIKDTPTGFLRVRSSSSTAATEIAQVKPGEKYPLVEEKEGWYKITYQEGKDGWISSRYAAKQE